jgi:hypothetical protein
MMRLVALMLIVLSSLTAGDFAGRWTGMLETPRGGRKSAVLVLKQDGGKITGRFGGSETDYREIEKAKIEGDVISFDLPFGPLVKFVLRNTGDRLTGEGTAESNGAKEIFKVDFRRDAR